jgi:hypothetical protein
VSLPPTGSFSQRMRLIAVLRVRNGGNPGCLVCYKRARILPTANEVCRRCFARHEREEGIMVWIWWVLRGRLGEDCGRLIVNVLVGR